MSIQNQNLSNNNNVGNSIIGKYATLSLSNPEDIFGNDNTDPKYTDLLYKDALKNADLRRIEFKEITRSLGVRENDIMVVFGERVEKYFRSKKLQTHQREFWKVMDDNLQQVVDNHIVFKDDHPSISSNDGVLEQIKDTTMQYFRNISLNNIDTPIQSKNAEEIHLQSLKLKQLAEEQHIPKDQRVELKPYDFVEPEKKKPIIEFQDLQSTKQESQSIFFGGDKSKSYEIPTSFVIPPSTYKEQLNPTEDQITHPYINKLEGKINKDVKIRPRSAQIPRKNSISNPLIKRPSTAHIQNSTSQIPKPLSRNSSQLSQFRASTSSLLEKKVISRENSKRRLSLIKNGEQLFESSSIDSPSARSFISNSTNASASGRIRLKEPISENVIKRVSLARHSNVTNKPYEEDSKNPEHSFGRRKRPSIFLTELEPSPTNVRILHSGRKDYQEHNAKSKEDLFSLLRRKNFPKGVTSFPLEELQQSNARVKSAKSGKIFVKELVKLPNLEILFPIIPIKKKRNLQTYATLTMKVGKLIGKKHEEVDMSELEQEKNKVMIEKYISECLELDKEMTITNQEIINMCEKKESNKSDGSDFDEEQEQSEHINQQDLDSEPRIKKHTIKSTVSNQKRIIDPSYWKFQFGATQLQTQYRLLNELDQRFIDRSLVYKSRFHLKQVAEKSMNNAASWSLSRATSKDGQLWKKYKKILQENEEDLHQATMFYSMLTTFCHTYNIPDSDTQRIFVDSIRNMLINGIKKDHSFFLREEILYGNLSLTILQDRKNIKLVNWLRSILGVSMSSFFQYIEEQGWSKDVHSDLQKLLTEVKKQNISSSILRNSTQ